ncbi:methyltransferase domain-containing protein [Hyphomonas sp. WL0036]|uniref:class I SAM-dependent methyltransferase n=1 Tax=Hyphomonas sediminis TaxID=2866160 RepID=UPI001C80808A|nr:methyltransferase domain-containing protein [Hyphomonas sediminis]MBY9068348.1 methyltransferase domain-containing protein [Hyphomonas sediminis]
MTLQTATATISPNQALWEKGDFTRLAATMRDSGTNFIKKTGVRVGDKVLDLGCGDGTTALPSARIGAEVTGIDIARNLVAAGNQRAAAENLQNCRFHHGDACNLASVADDSFDWVISVFGAMFAPRPADVAKEMVRVAKPGGRIVMGNWIAGDPTLIAQILKISGAYSPPPPEGFISPVRWGVEADVIQRFGEAGVTADQISFERETFIFDLTGTAEDFVGIFRDYYGPTMNAYAAAAANGKDADLEAELVDLFNRQNTSKEAGRMVLPATFLRVTVQV